MSRGSELAGPRRMSAARAVLLAHPSDVHSSRPWVRSRALNTSVPPLGAPRTGVPPTEAKPCGSEPGRAGVDVVDEADTGGVEGERPRFSDAAADGLVGLPEPATVPAVVARQVLPGSPRRSEPGPA